MRWPTTLRAQFVAVVTAAVILSNLAVVAILEIAREGAIRGARLDAAVDRIAAMFDYLSTVPEPQRETVMRTLSGNVFHYTASPEAPFANDEMSIEERGIASTLLADEANKKLGQVRVRLSEPTRPGYENAAVEITQALPSGGGWLVAHYERQPVPSTAPDILIAAALGSILTGAAAAWLAGRVSRPLSALAYAADEVARGRSVPRLRVKGPDDIRQAAEAFNEMSDRVTRTLERQRQLLSAVGHDLRTPIAAMRISSEFVEDSEVRDRLTRNLDELQSLTESVLAAARATAGEEKRKVDLAALIESVCDDLAEMGLPVEVNVEGTDPCPCRSNEIRRAVRNLIENAVRYGGAARVSLQSEPGAYVAIIEDDGPGIAEERLEDVFEPFVRLEGSRNTATGGAGLGLTLARSIAREHGGDVTIENRRGGGRVVGLRACLRLPREKVLAKLETVSTPAVAEGAMAK